MKTAVAIVFIIGLIGMAVLFSVLHRDMRHAQIRHILSRAQRPMTGLEIVAAARAEGRRISKGTVYVWLNGLVEAGEVERVTGGRQPTFSLKRLPPSPADLCPGLPPDLPLLAQGDDLEAQAPAAEEEPGGVMIASSPLEDRKQRLQAQRAAIEAELAVLAAEESRLRVIVHRAQVLDEAAADLREQAQPDSAPLHITVRGEDVFLNGEAVPVCIGPGALARWIRRGLVLAAEAAEDRAHRLRHPDPQET